MRHIPVSLLCLAVLASGCDSNTFPTAPGPVTSSAASPPPVGPRADAATSIVLGEMIRSRVTEGDPLCGAPPYQFRCRRYRVTIPASGIFVAVMAWGAEVLNPYPLDIGVLDERGFEYVPSVGPGPQRRVEFRVSAGSTYVIEIWSFLTPHEDFELRTAFHPD
jgi:hypothetical protein